MTTQTTKTILELQNITIAFEGQRIIEGFNCSILRGEHIAIVGPSGSGKSSLLSAILALISLECGTILHNGNLLNNNTLQHLFSQISWIPQQIEFPYDSTEEIFTNLFNLRVNSHLRYQRAEAISMLNKLGLDESALEKTPTQLSGGERQRVSLASTLLLQRPILLLDEPTSALDAASRKMVAELLRSLNDVTIIAVTHDLDLATAMDRTIDLGKE